MNDVVKLDLYIHTRTKYKPGSVDSLFHFQTHLICGVLDRKYTVIYWILKTLKTGPCTTIKV